MLCCGHLYSTEHHHIHSGSFKKVRDPGRRKKKQMQYKYPKMENSSIFNRMAISRNGVIMVWKDKEAMQPP